MSEKQLWQIANVRQLEIYGVKFFPFCHMCQRPALYIRRRDRKTEIKCGSNHVTMLFLPAKGRLSNEL